MSRVGKKPIQIPNKTTVTYEGGKVTVRGEKGSLARTVHPDVDLQIVDGTIVVQPGKDHRTARALQGLTRSLVANMVVGVSQGFTRVLEINGIGYRAEVDGEKVTLALGYSHPVEYRLPEGVTAGVDRRNLLTLQGIDKELLGQTAAAIRRLRPPEPYKGKGIKYAEEKIHRKVGKSGAK